LTQKDLQQLLCQLAGCKKEILGQND